MRYRVEYTNYFLKKVKKILKKSKFFIRDIEKLCSELEKNPQKGAYLGKNFYKIRISDSHSNQGKSGSFRIITYTLSQENKVKLITIYSKSERSTIYEKELIEIIKNEA